MFSRTATRVTQIIERCKFAHFTEVFIFVRIDCNPLQKHANSNILRLLSHTKMNFQLKNSGSFHISA